MMSIYSYFKRQEEPEEPGTLPTRDGSLALEPQDSPEQSSTASQDIPHEPPPKKPRVCHSDVGAFISSSPVSVSDKDKYLLITEHFNPEQTHKFPRAPNGRCFQHAWLLQYPWLRYSQLQNGGYCLPCALFFTPTVNFRSNPGVLVTKPLTNFQKAIEILNKHCEKIFHRSSVVQMDEFVKVMSNEQPSIRSRLNSANAERIARNRKKLRSIVETIVLCGRQNIPLRGYRDSISEVEQNPDSQHGNFRALLKFRVAAGDIELSEHLSQSGRNAQYTSARIQNEILEILGAKIVHTIVQRIQNATFFTVIADEVTDFSNKEQLGLVLRYVNPADSLIREDFLTFIECDCGVTGKALTDKILTFIRSIGLDPSNLRGQAYDGAGNMSGRVSGTAARIRSQYPLALYLHCASHSLNLAVVKSMDETSIRNMVGVVNRVSIFFSAHPKRHMKLEEAIDKRHPGSAIKKLKDLCRTRWVERIDALDRFATLLTSIVCCFETISAEGSHSWSRDSITDASTLLLTITTTQFLGALVITSSSLSYLMSLTRSLQSEAKDIVQAVSEISHIKTVIKDLRDNVDKYHGEWFSRVADICRAIGVQPSIPRVCARQSQRSNVPANNPTEYYRRTITIPLLDHMLSEMDNRFSAHQQTAVTGLCLVPSILISKSLVEIRNTLAQLGDLYSGDLPSPSSLTSEIHTWYLKWMK